MSLVVSAFVTSLSSQQAKLHVNSTSADISFPQNLRGLVRGCDSRSRAGIQTPRVPKSKNAVLVEHQLESLVPMVLSIIRKPKMFPILVIDAQRTAVR
ncbi:hypothetical protein BC827DRAFT_1376235 [Russula dissimulans]|nr:hypothetical protein BC827DRAFT_1376235 [Russula dissimulans]